MTGIRALLVEDNEGLASLYSELLAKKDVQVDHVPTTREGLERLAHCAYDLVFTDLSQNPPGIEVYKEAILKGIKDVYITTGGGRQELVDQARQVAGQRLLEQPFPIRIISDIVDQARSRKIEPKL